MLNVDFDIRNEINKDLLRDAQNERLIREARGHRNVLRNARHALGRNLVQAGQQLLKER